MAEQPQLQRHLDPPLMADMFTHLMARLIPIEDADSFEATVFVSDALRYHWFDLDLTCVTCHISWPCNEFLTRTAMGAAILRLDR